MMWACGRTAHPDSVLIMELLLAMGADVNAVDVQGRTPLHFAADHERRDCVDFLLEHGAAINVQTTEWGETPLHHAVKSHLDPFSRSTQMNNIMQVLVEAGADKTIRNKAGDTPFNSAEKAQLPALKHRKKAAAMMLLDPSASSSQWKADHGRAHDI